MLETTQLFKDTFSFVGGRTISGSVLERNQVVDTMGNVEQEYTEGDSFKTGVLVPSSVNWNLDENSREQIRDLSLVMLKDSITVNEGDLLSLDAGDKLQVESVRGFNDFLVIEVRDNPNV